MPNFRSLRRCAAVLLALVFAGPAAAQDDTLIDAFIKAPSYTQVKLSPDGVHLALVVPQGERSILATFRRADLKPVGNFAIAGKTRVTDFWWVGNDRIVLTFAEHFGGLRARPVPTGELYAVDVDGRNNKMLTGPRGSEDDAAKPFAMRRSSALVTADFVDLLVDYPDQVLIAATPVYDGNSTSIERMDVGSGRSFPQTRVPVPYAHVTADGAGLARFASGEDADGFHRSYYRAGASTEWTLLNDEKASGHREWMLGFNADESIAYLWVERASGPSVVEALTLSGMARRVALEDPRVDPAMLVRAPDGRTLLGVGYRNPKLTYRFFDDADPQSRVLKALIAAFAGQNVVIAGYSGDGKQALVDVGDDRDAGATFLFDIAARQAELLVAQQEWLVPDGMAPVKPFDLVARDGLPIPSLLTLPRSAAAKPPLVVMPHGGPYVVFDAWGFDSEAQLLAAHGYAVLQVNFRGSGNHGRKFEQAGHGEWGRAMQDDLTDATKAVIAQGLVDGGRVCIYGAGYGAYAALMGPVRAPGLFRCAAGYLGVYDLPQIQREDNDSRAERDFIARALGTDIAQMRERSPVTHAAAIKVPVFLAQGEQDKTAPKVHSERMRDALVAAGNPPEWLSFADEGHGYYRPEHQREYYRRLLAFFGKHLGVPATAAAAPPAAKTD